jgi:cobalamin biosynthesis Mg chelatase CobN
LRAIDAHLCEIKELQIRDGLHIFGSSPVDDHRLDTLIAIARIPRSGARPKDGSLHRAIAADLGLAGFDPLACDLAADWDGSRPEMLLRATDAPWRTNGDTVERLEILAKQAVLTFLSYDGSLPPGPSTASVLDWIAEALAPSLDRCGAEEIASVLTALGGRFVPPGPSGAPSRGRPDVLPTGKNFYSVDTRAAAQDDEDAERNPIRARILREAAVLEASGASAEAARAQAGWRIFGSAPGHYGSGLQPLFDRGNWHSDEDLARAYVDGGAHAYGQGSDGVPAQDALVRRLQTMDVVLQNQDSREHDLLDSNDYYQFQGGMVAAVRHLSGQQPAMYHGDHGNPQAPRMRTLKEEISRVIRARVVNPKWIDGVKRHGYKGAFEMAATVDYLFGFDATARVVGDHQYAMVADAYVRDAATRQFIQDHNPQALHDILSRLLEAMQRGLWQAPATTNNNWKTCCSNRSSRWKDSDDHPRTARPCRCRSPSPPSRASRCCARRCCSPRSTLASAVC